MVEERCDQFIHLQCLCVVQNVNLTVLKVAKSLSLTSKQICYIQYYMLYQIIIFDANSNDAT